MLTTAILTPHPPVIIPAIGGANIQKYAKTVSALMQLSQDLKEQQPDTIVVLTPHGEAAVDRFSIRVPKAVDFTAGFADFGTAASERSYPRDRVFTAQLIEAALSMGIALEPSEQAELDYGTSVPLHYLASGLPTTELVSIGISLASPAAHFQLGQLIRDLANKSDKKIALIASAELSHRTSKSSPHGFHPRAADWDRQVLDLLEQGKAASLLVLDPFEVDAVGGQQYRGLAALLGAVENESFQSKILSYEAPSGIGCCVASFTRPLAK